MTNLREAAQMALDALEEFCEHGAMLRPLERRDALRAALAADKPSADRLAQPEQEPDIEAMAEAVHDAYLTTCDALGWGVKPENRVPYAELTEDSKELDRASVRAVLKFTAPPQREPILCGCGDQIMPDDGAECGTCVTARNATQREWQGLTDEEYSTLMQQADHDAAKTGSVFQNLRRAIEQALREKNT